MTIRAALILAALGGALYLAWPHLPVWGKRPIDNMLRRLRAPFDSGQAGPGP